MKEVLINLRLN